MEAEGKIPEGGRNLSQTAKRSAKYRNQKGPAKYFAPYKNLNYIVVGEDVDASDVEVPVAPLRDKLNDKIWTVDKRLKPEVRQALLDIANSYYESLDLNLKIKDILFTGSLANFGWTSGSDIDLHLIVDYTGYEQIPFLEDYLYLKKRKWLKNHKISIYGFEVEPFAKNEEKQHDYKAIYSVLNDSWVVKPRKDKPTIDFETVKEKAASLMNDIDKISEISNTEKRHIESKKLGDKIGGLRNIGLSQEGEYSNENLIYKTLRRAGYIDKLGDVEHKAVDQKLSLNESFEEKTKLVNLGVTPMVHTLKVQKGIDGMSPEKVEIVKNFINFVCVKLKIEGPVHVFLRKGRDEYIQTTASYVPGDNTNHIRCGGRALVDILRSIAHELVHNRQRELNMFKPGEVVQNIGGHIEDQANSVAGVFIKDFTHNYGFDGIYDF